MKRIVISKMPAIVVPSQRYRAQVFDEPSILGYGPTKEAAIYQLMIDEGAALGIGIEFDTSITVPKEETDDDDF